MSPIKHCGCLNQFIVHSVTKKSFRNIFHLPMSLVGIIQVLCVVLTVTVPLSSHISRIHIEQKTVQVSLDNIMYHKKILKSYVFLHFANMKPW